MRIPSVIPKRKIFGAANAVKVESQGHLNRDAEQA
jgi:hypothetical protein